MASTTLPKNATVYVEQMQYAIRQINSQAVIIAKQQQEIARLTDKLMVIEHYVAKIAHD